MKQINRKDIFILLLEWCLHNNTNDFCLDTCYDTYDDFLEFAQKNGFADYTVKHFDGAVRRAIYFWVKYRWLYKQKVNWDDGFKVKSEPVFNTNYYFETLTIRQYVRYKDRGELDLFFEKIPLSESDI